MVCPEENNLYAFSLCSNKLCLTYNEHMVLDRFVEHTEEGGDGEKEDALYLSDMWV